MRRCNAYSTSGKRCTRYEGHQGVHWNWRDGGSALWLLVGMLASGCIGDVWHVDSRFTAEERADIDRAAEMWAGVGQTIVLEHGCFVNGLEETGRHIVRGSERDIHELAPSMTDGANAKYLYEPLRERIVVNVDKGGMTPFWQVMAHEMGHSLGLEHVGDKRALMYERSAVESLGCITRVDIQEMCRTAGCPGDVPRGCDE